MLVTLGYILVALVFSSLALLLSHDVMAKVPVSS